jgi:hypothetical protein
MAADEVAMLNMFMSIALAATLAMRSLQPISTELPGPSWKAISQAEACFDSDLNECMLGP